MCQLADICSAAKIALLNDLVGATEQWEREGEAKRLCGLEVDDQFNPGDLLHWQVSRFLAVQDSRGVATDQAISIGNVAP
jgi:hypothetical protein